VGDNERDEAVRLIRRYDAFFREFGGERIEYGPYIRGSGFANSCNGDLAVGNTLFEVKTVNRNIAGKDVRQLLVYLALESAVETRRWTNAGFFNPRRSCFYAFSIDSFVERIAGGREVSDVFDDLIEFFSSRDIQLDARF
jgi:hypothetical protein